MQINDEFFNKLISAANKETQVAVEIGNRIL